MHTAITHIHGDHSESFKCKTQKYKYSIDLFYQLEICRTLKVFWEIFIFLSEWVIKFSSDSGIHFYYYFLINSIFFRTANISHCWAFEPWPYCTCIATYYSLPLCIWCWLNILSTAIISYKSRPFFNSLVSERSIIWENLEIQVSVWVSVVACVADKQLWRSWRFIKFLNIYQD